MSTTVRLSRELYLPRELIFDAWTQAEHVAQWYAPQGSRVDEVVVEPWEGGRFDLTWFREDGVRVRESGRFLRFDPPVGFECSLSCAGQDTGESETTLCVALSDQEDTCRIELRQQGAPDDAAQRWREIWDARLERLEAYFSAI